MARIRSIPPEQFPRVQEAWPYDWCSLYIVEELPAGLTKVGVASHPARRLSALQCGNSRQLALRSVWVGSRDDCMQMERVVLVHFSAKRIKGEWLDFPYAKVAEFVDASLAGDA